MNSLPKTLTIHINLDDLDFDEHGQAAITITSNGSRPELLPTALGQRILDMLWRKSTPQKRGWVSRSSLIHGLGNVKSNDLDEELLLLESSGRAERRVLPSRTKPTTEWRITIHGGIFQ